MSDKSPYQDALEAAGVTVHAFEEFGSYQGDWVAKVTFGEKAGYIHGGYGSCTGCDAFEGQFGHLWEHGPTTEQLAAFAASYLDDIEPIEKVRASFEENVGWDTDAVAALKWLATVEGE